MQAPFASADTLARDSCHGTRLPLNSLWFAWGGHGFPESAGRCRGLRGSPAIGSRAREGAKVAPLDGPCNIGGCHVGARTIFAIYDKVSASKGLPRMGRLRPASRLGGS